MTKGWAIADGRMGMNASHPVCVQAVGAYRHSTDGVHFAIHSLVPLLEAQTRGGGVKIAHAASPRSRCRSAISGCNFDPYRAHFHAQRPWKTPDLARNLIFVMG